MEEQPTPVPTPGSEAWWKNRLTVALTAFLVGGGGAVSGNEILGGGAAREVAEVCGEGGTIGQDIDAAVQSILSALEELSSESSEAFEDIEDLYDDIDEEIRKGHDRIEDLVRRINED